MVITTPAAVETEVEIKTVPEAEAVEENLVEEPAPEEVEQPVSEESPEEELVEEPEKELEEDPEESGEREENIREILDLLEDNPDGLRMVEISDILGFENWRSLIPMMRELLDAGEINKVDSTYYAA